MDKLKAVIKEYGRWKPLEDNILIIETYLDIDFGLAVKNSKSILESISKEICEQKSVELRSSESISSSLKKTCKAIGYNGGDLVTQLSTSIANIGHQVGSLRNEIGVTSHGRTMDQLKDRNNGIDKLTKIFLVDATELVSCFLIRNFENENPRKHHKSQAHALAYSEAEEFNESWDNSFSEFVMGDYSYPASEILFNMDNQAYVNEYKAFTEDRA
ncbi:abortive infection family protein [Bathymodiolus azoricus thioautotrophic gill symbiont]|jgi:hypothetical protein|uniref:Abortive infection protein-like C-terminal domain-containing protein n=1 Tax=Bathymodiolus azoricus thioautotrophic gill symbiont TaxID=235205 RepID=A0A1H6MC98_9GAMM|nr:abortive infection family protein [Bathymodiolus azoricus thioautotrophic gill symbiont]SEH99154.1 conserved hypothetical protein [Bathymodiolus azoricus thioautotrophic gill symbiont]